MKFRKEFERFRSLVELHRKEHAEEGFGRVESIRSAVANIQRLSRPPERAQLQTMVADLYKNKRAKLRNKRLDLWEDMKKSASSRADPSPLEATQFAAITIESTTEELLSMEMRARAWYASKSRFLAVAQRQDDDSAGRDDNEEGDGSFLTSITAGLDSIHDLLLGDSDDEKDKNSQENKDDREIEKHLFLRQERLDLLRNIKDIRVAEEEYDDRHLSEKLKALEKTERETVTEHFEKFGVAHKVMSKVQSFGLPPGLDMGAVKDANNPDVSSAEPSMEDAAVAGADPNGDDNGKEDALLSDPSLEFEFEQLKTTLQNMQEYFAEKLANIEAVGERKVEAIETAMNGEKEQDGASKKETGFQEENAKKNAETEAKEASSKAQEDEIAATRTRMRRDKEDIMGKAMNSTLGPQTSLMNMLMVVLKEGHAYGERRIKNAIQRKKEAYKICKNRITRDRDRALGINEKAIAVIQKDMENLHRYKATEVRLAESNAEGARAGGNSGSSASTTLMSSSGGGGGGGEAKEENEEKEKETGIEEEEKEEELGGFLEIVEAIEWLLLHHIDDADLLSECCAELKASKNHFRGKKCLAASTIKADTAMIGILLGIVGRHGRVEEDLALFEGSLDLSKIEISLSGERDLAPLQGMTKLQRLDVTACAITDTAISSSLESLWHLTTFIACNNAIGDLRPCAKLYTLTELDLTGNRSIVSIEPLRGLVGMKTIRLSLCAITSLGPLQGMRELRSLKAYDNELCSDTQKGVLNDLLSLAMMPYLRDVDLHNNHIKNAAPLSNLKFYAENSLHSLHLGNNALTNLEFLTAPNPARAAVLGITTTVSPDGKVLYGEWNNLTSLILQNNHIQDLSAFAEACLPDLRRLDLSGQTADPSTSTRDFVLDLSPLAKETLYMPALRVLDLADNELQSVGKLGSANFPSLEELDLSHNLLTDVQGLAWDAVDENGERAMGLTRLKLLNLEGNRVQDCVNLQHLTTLRELYLNHNCLSGNGVFDMIGKLRDLVELDLTENKGLKIVDSDVAWILDEHVPRLSEDSREKLEGMPGHTYATGGKGLVAGGAKCGCF